MDCYEGCTTKSRILIRGSTTSNSLQIIMNPDLHKHFTYKLKLIKIKWLYK